MAQTYTETDEDSVWLRFILERAVTFRSSGCALPAVAFVQII